MGVTPCQLALPNHRDLHVEFRKTGYESRVAFVTSELEAGYLILDIFPGLVFGIIPIAVDAATGDWNGLASSHVHASLEEAPDARYRYDLDHTGGRPSRPGGR